MGFLARSRSVEPAEEPDLEAGRHRGGRQRRQKMDTKAGKSSRRRNRSSSSSSESERKDLLGRSVSEVELQHLNTVSVRQVVPDEQRRGVIALQVADTGRVDKSLLAKVPGDTLVFPCKRPMLEPDFKFPDPLKRNPRTFMGGKKAWYSFPDPIDNTLVRLTSFFVFITALLVAIGFFNLHEDGFWYLIPVVLYDFAVRTVFGPVPFSPFGVLATLILMALDVKPNYVPSSAKRFSFFLGIILNTVLTILHFGVDSEFKRSPLLVLNTFSALESIGGFCVGCWFFQSFFRWRDYWRLRADYSKLDAPSGPAKHRFKNPFVDSDLPEQNHGFDYDMIVIGGGSGGLAASKEAARLGRKVAVLDYVTRSPAGSWWGIGGTCVNVGCIPKKLYHTSALLRKSMDDAKAYGWTTKDSPTFRWSTLRSNIQEHIHNLNNGYITGLKSAQVEYINAFAKFAGPNKIIAVDDCGREQKLTARRILIAVGGRPNYPDIPGAREFGITSDDIFSLEDPPGKTLVVGASYIALECAGFLAGLDFDVSVMVRSILLRGFDRDMADRIEEHMEEEEGVRFIRQSVPISIEEVKSKSGDGKQGRKLVRFKTTVTDNRGRTTEEENEEEFDTVLFAIGRSPNVDRLNLKAAGNISVASNGKLHTYHERTTVPHIYALGDCIANGLELTPVAIKAGLFLAKRLYGGGTEVLNYYNVPTTVFTPLEYGSIGLSEELANDTFGEENIEVFHAEFTPLEYAVPQRKERPYCKVIVNYLDHERVIGMHYLGPNAAEITQGFGTAFAAGLTKSQWDSVVGIHPCCAEELVSLRRSKRSGVDPKKTGC